MYKTKITEKDVEARQEDKNGHTRFEKLKQGVEKNEKVFEGLFELGVWVWGMDLVFCSWSSP